MKRAGLFDIVGLFLNDRAKQADGKNCADQRKWNC